MVQAGMGKRGGINMLGGGRGERKKWLKTGSERFLLRCDVLYESVRSVFLLERRHLMSLLVCAGELVGS